MTQPSHRLVLLTIIVLGIGLFFLDLYLPLGIGSGGLYVGLVVLSLALPDRKIPLIVAATCSVLALSDAFFGVTLPSDREAPDRRVADGRTRSFSPLQSQGLGPDGSWWFQCCGENSRLTPGKSRAA